MITRPPAASKSLAFTRGLPEDEPMDEGNGPCWLWVEEDGFGLYRLDEDGQPRLIEPDVDVPIVTDDPLDASRRWCEEHAGFVAIEGYLLEVVGDSTRVAPGCWAWSSDSANWIEAARGRRGVPAGTVYLGCTVRLDIVRAAHGGDILDLPISDLKLPKRVANYFRVHSRIATVRELLAVSRSELLRLPGMGPVSTQEVDAALAEHGLHLPWASTAPIPAGRPATDAERIEPLSALRLSPNAARPLIVAGVTTIGAVLDHTAADLLRLPRVGEKVVGEVRERLRERGLALKVYQRSQPPPPTADRATPIAALCDAHGVGYGKVRLLKAVGIETVGDLTTRSAADLRAIKGIGSLTVFSISEWLRPFGFVLADTGT